MLRRNIDAKAGLVNGAIGTVVAISATQITIKFDHAIDTYDIEQVRSAFIVMKNYYVYRTQFPLILYAVTIHKYQGLSLDCAIIDLSSKVFQMACLVALSRVKTISGMHLVAFEDIRVSAGCIKEINRFRSCYRSDLPHIEVPVTRKHAKRKATASAVDGPPSKFLCLKSPLHLLHAIAISTYGLCDYWFRSITWKCVQRHLNIGNYCSSYYRPYP